MYTGLITIRPLTCTSQVYQEQTVTVYVLFYMTLVYKWIFNAPRVILLSGLSFMIEDYDVLYMYIGYSAIKFL